MAHHVVVIAPRQDFAGSVANQSAMVATSPSGWQERGRRPGSLALTVAFLALAVALAWLFVSAGGLDRAPNTASACEQLWQEGRNTADLAGADHDAFFAACVD